MRHFSIEDAYANAIGVAIALTVFLIAKKIFPQSKTID